MGAGMKDYTMVAVAIFTVGLIVIAAMFIGNIHRSDGETLAFEQCMSLKGVPTFNGWTGNMESCVWGPK
jgi:hypothetical protein